VQVGTPHEIYVQPVDKFVSEFMGEVNVIDVRSGANGRVVSSSPDGAFATPALPAGFTAGHLVVRPEFMRFIARPEEADNHLRGRIYNEYALGSRIQYQVRVGDHVFIVEKLRQQAFAGRPDDEVLIGWDARDSIVVED
jgi:spermidine/putrescine transport system ATP-binding protein